MAHDHEKTSTGTRALLGEPRALYFSAMKLEPRVVTIGELEVYLLLALLLRIEWYSIRSMCYQILKC